MTKQQSPRGFQVRSLKTLAIAAGPRTRAIRISNSRITHFIVTAVRQSPDFIPPARLRCWFFRFEYQRGAEFDWRNVPFVAQATHPLPIMSSSIPDRDDWFDDESGFPRPNWGAVFGWLRVYVKEEDLDDAWQQCARHWLERLRTSLGGGYSSAESEHFHLLSEQTPDAKAKALSFFESTRAHIYRVLGDVAPKGPHGKHMILRFTDTDDYYAYIAHFFPDGAYAGSAGIFLRDSYLHIAHPQSWSAAEERRTIVHELTHNLLAHLPLPAWLNEALAVAFETDIAGSDSEPLSRELAARHREYWNATTIQEFWRGESFSDVDGQELAYSLSRILLNLIHADLRPPESEFRRFVLRADWGDAGTIAVREHLQIELADLVAGFLGPGVWSPDPKSWRRETAADAEERGAHESDDDGPGAKDDGGAVRR